MSKKLFIFFVSLVFSGLIVAPPKNVSPPKKSLVKILHFPAEDDSSCVTELENLFVDLEVGKKNDWGFFCNTAEGLPVRKKVECAVLSENVDTFEGPSAGLCTMSLSGFSKSKSTKFSEEALSRLAPSEERGAFIPVCAPRAKSGKLSAVSELSESCFSAPAPMAAFAVSALARVATLAPRPLNGARRGVLSGKLPVKSVLPCPEPLARIPQDDLDGLCFSDGATTALSPAGSDASSDDEDATPLSVATLLSSGVEKTVFLGRAKSNKRDRGTCSSVSFRDQSGCKDYQGRAVDLRKSNALFPSRK